MNVRAFAVAVCLWSSALLAAQGPNVSPDFIVLRQDTKVDLRLEQDISSATSKKGQKVRFTVVDDLVVDGRVVAPKGSEVDVTISSVERARTNASCTVVEDGWMQLGQPTLRLGQMQIPLDEETKKIRSEDDSRGFPWGLVLFAPIEAPILAIAALKGSVENAGHHPAQAPPADCPLKEFEMKQGTTSSYYLKHDVKLRATQFPLKQ